MRTEIDYCVLNKIPVISAMDGDEEQYFKRVVQAINCHLTSMLR